VTTKDRRLVIDHENQPSVRIRAEAIPECYPASVKQRSLEG
jgi:hypothetical protein